MRACRQLKWVLRIIKITFEEEMLLQSSDASDAEHGALRATEALIHVFL
jgi:hypothetical protein